MEELELLEQAEQEQEQALKGFLGGLGAVAKTFWGKVIDLVDDLRTPDSITRAQARQRNWQAVTRYRLQLRPLLSFSGYDDSVNELMERMKQVTLNVEAYYEPLGLSTHGGQFERMARESMEMTRGQLVNVVPDVAFINPVEEALQNAVMRGSSLGDLRKELRQTLVESGLPTRYVHQQATDALWTYHRNYSSSVGDALGLTHYYYDGVIVSNTRSFCSERTGKAYGKKEIEEWALLDWQGKIPGTTKESIFWHCGGYNCKHVLRPITKNLYERIAKETIK